MLGKQTGEDAGNGRGGSIGYRPGREKKAILAEETHVSRIREEMTQ